MCRLFGLHGGDEPVHATFWLLDAPDSLSEQSRRNPDGAGIGVFGADGVPLVDKEPMAAWQDAAFASAARELTGRTFVAHVRYASTGALTRANTHPFSQDGRLLAHNGVVEDVAGLRARAAELGTADLIGGQSDSEAVFAVITGETRRHDGDLGAGIRAAVGWIGRELPVFALNLVITTPDELWALRYPDTHPLWLLERRPGGAGGLGHLDVHSERIRAHASDFATRPAVVVATERMDDDPGWRQLDPGELVAVRADLSCATSTPFEPPRHRLGLADLGEAASSQHG